LFTINKYKEVSLYIQIKSDEGVLNAWKSVRIHSKSFFYTLGNFLDLEEEHMSGLDLKEASENCNCLVKGEHIEIALFWTKRMRIDLS